MQSNSNVNAMYSYKHDQCRLLMQMLIKNRSPHHQIINKHQLSKPSNGYTHTDQHFLNPTQDHKHHTKPKITFVKTFKKKKKKLRSPNHIPNKKPSRGGEPFPVQQIKTKTHKKKKTK